jgi:hypothetical protein
MGARIAGFILYLALSYGVIYVLISKRFLRGWNVTEPQVRAAILAAIVIIIAVGTMLVGPLPMVLMFVALVAFIDYVRSSEALAVIAGDSAPDWRPLPSLVGAIGSLRRVLNMASADHGFDRVRHVAIPAARRALAVSVAKLSGYVRSLSGKPGGDAGELSVRGDNPLNMASADHGLDRVRHAVIPAARRALAMGLAKLSGYVRSLSRKPDGNAVELSAHGGDQTPAGQAPPDQVQPPPPLTLAEGHGLDAVRAALAPPNPAGRSPTRDEAKRLLDHLEGRA